MRGCQAQSGFPKITVDKKYKLKKKKGGGGGFCSASQWTTVLDLD